MATDGPPAAAKQSKLVTLVNYPLDWLEERSGLVGVRSTSSSATSRATRAGGTRSDPRRSPPFLVQAGTGVVLAMYYKP